MNSDAARNWFTVFGVVWVGGGGFLMFRYPEFFTRLNVWIGFKRFGSPKYVTFIRRLGVIEMILAALAAVSDLVLPALGVKW